jgi:hypothetical protein
MLMVCQFLGISILRYILIKYFLAGGFLRPCPRLLHVFCIPLLAQLPLDDRGHESLGQGNHRGREEQTDKVGADFEKD